VKDLLEELSTREEVKVGLVTGNLESIGWAKMQVCVVRTCRRKLGKYLSSIITRVSIVMIEASTQALLME
jgi:hypothetical protein